MKHYAQIDENGFVKTIDENPNKWIKLSAIIGVYSVSVQKAKNIDKPNHKVVVCTSGSTHDVYATSSEDEVKKAELEMLKLSGSKHV